MKLTPGDNAMAEALRIAEDHLKRLGWKYTPADVGETARKILDAVCNDAGRQALDTREREDE